jgi:hypothetical protein
MKTAGPVGAAAKSVAEALHPHFLKEEAFALPPLGLLAAIAGGRVTEDMKSILNMTDRLKADMPVMLGEHRAIVGTLEKLERASQAENNREGLEFAEKLKLHARTEEEVLYPAAILVGEYVKLRLGK